MTTQANTQTTQPDPTSIDAVEANLCNLAAAAVVAQARGMELTPEEESALNGEGF